MADLDKQLIGMYLQVAIDKATNATNPTTGVHLLRLASLDVIVHLKGEADMTDIFRDVIQKSNPLPGV